MQISIFKVENLVKGSVQVISKGKLGGIVGSKASKSQVFRKLMILCLFVLHSKNIKNEIAKRIIPLTFVPSHRPSLFTLRNKLMCLIGAELSQEIFDPAITFGVKPKMVIFTPNMRS